MGNQTPPQKQRLAPLFVASVGFVALGFGVTFADLPERSPEVVDLPSPFLLPLDTPAADEPLDEVRLEYAARDRRFRLDIRQQRRASEGAIARARAGVMVSDEVKSEEPLRWTRRYLEPRVQLASDGEMVGSGVAREVERLLVTSREEVTAEITGRVVDYALVTSEAAQLRQLLAVLGDAAAFLQPRMPREPVRAGEEWSWSVPVSASTESDSLIAEESTSVEGNTEFVARVVGATAPGRVLIEMKISSHSEGEVVSEGESMTFGREGEGGGWTEWNVEEGRVVRSRIRYSQTETAAGERHTSEYGLDLHAIE